MLCSSHTRTHTLTAAKYVGLTDRHFLSWLDAIFQYDPRRRLTPQESIQHPFFYPLFPFNLVPPSASPTNDPDSSVASRNIPVSHVLTVPTGSENVTGKRPAESQLSVLRQRRKKDEFDGGALTGKQRETGSPGYSIASTTDNKFNQKLLDQGRYHWQQRFNSMQFQEGQHYVSTLHSLPL